MSKRYIVNEEFKLKIKEASEKSGSVMEASRKTGISYNSFKKYAKKFGCWKPKVVIPSYKTDDILKGLHPKFQCLKLKNRLFKEGLKQKVCEVCGLRDIWNERSLTLELHHKNGDPRDHEWGNLQILCPNCHSQTETFRGGNSKKKLK